MTYARRSGNTFLLIARGAAQADILHQADSWDESEACFREAEEIQVEYDPKSPLLYSVAGFQYCELLLAAAERAAWRHMLNSSLIQQSLAVPRSTRRFWRANRLTNLHPAANPSSMLWTVSATLPIKLAFPLASSPAPGYVSSSACPLGRRARKATSTKPLKLPSAGRCHCS